MPPNLSDRQIRIYMGPRRFPATPRSRRWPRSTAWPRASHSSRARSSKRPCSNSARPTNRARPRSSSAYTTAPDDRPRAADRAAPAAAARIAAVRRDARDALLPRHRSRHDRSGRGLPRRSRRSDRPPQHPEARWRRGVRGHERPADRPRPAPGRQPVARVGRRDADVDHPPRSAPPPLEADPCRLARRFRRAVDERPDRRRPRARRGRRPHARGQASDRALAPARWRLRLARAPSWRSASSR